MNGTCDCAWGFKGPDCGFPFASAVRNDVCELNPNKFDAACKMTMNVPCNGRGTYDGQDFRYVPLRDDIYDCESDSGCVCRRGYQGSACEIGNQHVFTAVTSH